MVNSITSLTELNSEKMRLANFLVLCHNKIMTKIIPRSVLEDLYTVKGLSHKAIAAKLGISEPTVRTRFRNHGLTVRTRGSWMVKYQKFPFDGNEQEKAYMMGFRIGDIHAYIPSKGSNIIVARTNSTQDDQLEVMRSLFSKYGGVVVSGSGRAKNINCYLDMSFSFLLVDKPYIVEPWIRNNIRNAIAFTAGYVDAEANFILNQGKGRFTLVSYDKDILHWMHGQLLAMGLRSKLRLLANKGQANYNGTYNWNADLWRININEAHSLLEFCRVIIPYLRHRKRITDVQKCMKNILDRKNNGTI